MDNRQKTPNKQTKKLFCLLNNNKLQHGSCIHNVILRNMNVFKNPKEYSHINEDTGNEQLGNTAAKTR